MRIRRFSIFQMSFAKGFEKTFTTQTRLLETLISDSEQFAELEPLGFHSDIRDDTDRKEMDTSDALLRSSDALPEPAFNRDMCMEFAIGSVAKVLGPEFAVVDTYKVRVRLPDEPLMLVDRIISVEGEKRSLGSGRVVTEHDVLPEHGIWTAVGRRSAYRLKPGRPTFFYAPTWASTMRSKEKGATGFWMPS